MAITVNVDGVGKVNFPDGYTPEKIKFAIENDILPRMKTATRDIRAEAGQIAADETPVMKKGLVALGRGLTDIGQGAKQLYLHAKDKITAPTMEDLVLGTRESDRYDAQVADELARFKPLEDQTSGATIGRVVGSALPTLVVPAGTLARGAGAVIKGAAPAVAAKVAGSVAADAALTGAAQGALTVAGEGETHLGNATKGALGGAGAVLGLNFIGKLAAPVVKRIANYVNPVELAAGKVTPEVEAKLAADGIDLKNLTEEARKKLAEMAESASVAVAENPAAMARQARLESLPVPIKTATQGQISKDFGQNQLEQSLAKSASSGAPIREAFEKTDEALLQNLDKFRTNTGAKIATEGDTGRSVDKALRKRIEQSESRVSSLYREAEKKGETMAPVSPGALVDWLTENGAAAASVPAIKSIADTLKKFGAVKFTEEGATAGRDLTINELENIRKLAVKLGKSDDATGHFMGEVKKVIDGITENAGGEAYKAARAARVEHALKFEEPGVITAVTGMRSRTDRAVPFEDVFKKAVINGSIDDLKTLKSTLIANDPATREAGVQALKDLRGQAMQYFKDAATNNAQGTTSEAALRRAYNQIGPEKMEELFGRNVAKQFTNFLEAVKDLKVAPKGSFNPSGTAGELVNWVDRLLGMVPGGQVTGFAVRGAKQLAENAKAAGQVESALNPAAGRQAAQSAAVEAQQNERLRALLEGPGARRAGRYAGLLGAAAASNPGP